MGVLEQEGRAATPNRCWQGRAPAALAGIGSVGDVPMAELAKVFEDRGQWRVEWFDDNGRC
jgi:hypothetical protein